MIMTKKIFMLLAAVLMMSANAMAQQGSVSSKEYKKLQEGLKYIMMAKEAWDNNDIMCSLPPL